MRRGIYLFAALAFIGCASEDVPSEKLAGSPSPGGDVTGSWTVVWGTMVGTNTYVDTLGPKSFATRTVRDTCSATGTLTLTQHTPVAYVTGPYTVNQTCTSHLVTSKGLDSVLVGTVAVVAADSVRNANMGSGEFAFTLDKPARQVQLGLVSGSNMSGPVRWNFTIPTRPTKARGIVSGLFTATSP
jgi:hypothetical protein